MASSSSANQGLVPVQEGVPTFYYYPQALAKYQDVVAFPKLFMDTLGKLHATMGTKFMIPIIGGKDLDLHRLFVEVTSRGGIKRVLAEKKWKEVTTTFSFPPSATNASFILRKYYMSLLHHYEQVYYFKARAWTPVSTDAWQKTAPTSTHAVDDPVQPSAEVQVAPLRQQRLPSAESTTPYKRQRINVADSFPGEPSVGCSVTGMIDGKFESGYLVTVTIGSEQLRGVIYQTPQDTACQIGHRQGLQPQYQNASRNISDNATLSASGVTRRRRRKKSEMKKRDPAHPKPNRSGYNFFFAEQHAWLKPLHPGKDRGISRIIGESWNNLNESERAIYQEKALRDKERYRVEMLHYKESLRVGQIMGNAVPIQEQQPLNLDGNIGVMEENIESEGGGSSQALENELTNGKSDRSNSEDDEEVDDDGTPIIIDSGTESLVTDMHTINKPLPLFEMEKELVTMIGEIGEKCSTNDNEIMAKKSLLSLEEESLVIPEEKSAGTDEEETIQKEPIIPVPEKNASGGSKGYLGLEKASSPIQEKDSVVPMQLGTEVSGSSAAIQEQESFPSEDRANDISVSAPVKEITETESASAKEKESVLPEDRIVTECNPKEANEPVDLEGRVEDLKRVLPVQEELMAADMERVGKAAVPAEEGEMISSQQQGKGMLV